MHNAPTFSVRVIFSRKIHVHISMYFELKTTVLVDFASDEANFYDSLERQADLALYTLTVIFGLEWHSISRKGRGYVKFPKEIFSDRTLLSGIQSVGQPHLDWHQGLNRLPESVKVVAEALVNVSSFDSYEYQVEKLGKLMGLSLHINQ